MGDGKEDRETKRVDTRRFAAFISYSHVDTAIAAKLQRRLERYRLPKRLATNEGRPQALGAIFRDREDLAAAISLSAAIREALARSDAVIILCSPDAAQSAYVATEIGLFRKIHPDKPILAALIAGDPAGSFPPALTAAGYEPLAADLRPEGDGQQLGFLKIVAGIAGVPLDSLIQRDAQRRIRRVTAITAGALAAMLVMGIMTAYAISARNEAARQRSAAEGLVEYMLTDLREKLRGVGRLDVMDAVNVRAMEHYAAQGDLSALPDDSLERRARVLLAMGEDYEKRGNLSQAAQTFRAAHGATAALLAKEPENPDRVFAHSQSEYWIGFIAYLQKDWRDTETHWTRYRDLANRLVRAQPGNADWMREAGYAEGNLCTLGLESGKRPQAMLESCHKALTRMESVRELLPVDGQSTIDVANRHAWVADAYKRIGDRRSELLHRKSGDRLMAQLIARDPKNMDYRDMWVAIQIALAATENENGNRDSALNRLAKAERVVARMIATDPSNQTWKGRATAIRKKQEIINAGKKGDAA